MLRDIIISLLYPLCILGQLQTFNLHYHVYHSDRVRTSNMYYDCLLFNEAHKPLKGIYHENKSRPYQIIPFCIRPLDQFTETFISNTIQVTHGTSITFETLRNQNYTSKDLYLSSVPIDVIERYQEFLESSNRSLFKTVIYNCTIPWFGEYCQYTFNSTLSFDTIVRNYFENTFAEREPLFNTTCFMFMKCNRGPSPFCLDWRDVCDGKIDCLEDGSIDEVGCDDIETVECKSGEFRCRNGFCIPSHFFDDDVYNPDCIDRSDEGDLAKLLSYLDSCRMDPAFRCEETACRNEHDPLCGTLECRILECEDVNNRLRRVKYSWKENYHLSFDCWKSLVCLTVKKSSFDVFKDVNCPTQDVNRLLFQKECPSVFFFPATPTLLNHVRFVFEKKFIDESFVFSVLLPYYICYDEQLCEFLPSTISINGSTCRRFSEIDIKEYDRIWGRFEQSIQKFFRRCLTKINSYDQCPKSKPYRCANSSKCLSLVQVHDGFEDCFEGDDEHLTNTCSLSDQEYRFRCQGGEKCVSIAKLGQFEIECTRFRNNSNNIQRKVRRFYPQYYPLVFSMLCNGFVEYIMIDGMNRTDEMNCEYWPCNNVYTRCDDYGTWHCVDGADEVDCPRNPCRPDGHPCVLLNNRTLACLPLSKFNDGIIDCLGGYDERAYCEANSSSLRLSFYRCFDTTRCFISYGFCRKGYSPCNSDGTTTQLSCNDMSQPNLEFCWNSISPPLSHTSDLYLHTCVITSYEFIDVKPFTLRNHLTYPINDVVKTLATMDVVRNKISNYNSIQQLPDYRTNVFCHRGIPLYSNYLHTTYCLCPPAYYGHQCQYQSQRVSITLQFRTAEHQTLFTFVIMLIDNHTNIHSYEQLQFLATRDCPKKFNLYLLYSSRPKLLNYTYHIRIDAYDKINLKYYTSFLYPIQFLFLPVQRLAFLVDIPLQKSLPGRKKCPLKCSHGECTQYSNLEEFFCRCFEGYSGILCSINNDCNCSPGSICVGTSDNRSICVCPQDKFGPRCYLNGATCTSNSCPNNSQCIATDVKLSGSESEYFCLCSKGISGSKCENEQMKIEFHFDKSISIPQAMLIHFIFVPSGVMREVSTVSTIEYQELTQTTQITKIGYTQNSALVYNLNPFHLIFVEFNQDYYLALLQHNYTVIKNLSTTIIPQHRCKPIQDVLNQQIQVLPRWHRAKHYHIPCQNQSDLVCFYDHDYFMCLCNTDRHANCFQFNHNSTDNCFGYSYCQNDGQCHQDSKTCPTSSVCFCKQCYFGTNCQFTTIGFGLSLDNILGYSIWPHVRFTQQPSIVKITTTFVVFMWIIAVINSFLLFITFLRKRSLEVGCGIYLLTSSVISIATITLLSLKFFLLIFSQMSMITNRSFLLANCIMMDMLLKSFLAIGDWLNACVAIERVMTAYIGINFSKKKSKYYAKRVVIGMCVLTLASYIPDPIHRTLLEDTEEQRQWCVVAYSSSMQIFTMIINIIHFCIPLGINIISVLVIIVLVARRRSTPNSEETYRGHLRRELKKHKHRLLSSTILIIIAMPRLIISFISKCMESARDPDLYIAGYFISFIPPLLIFVIFVLPSEYYRKQFKDALIALRQTIKRRLFSHDF